jgi:anaerobic magnesium-protoporphyrin IX monomethyl ester cyclase
MKISISYPPLESEKGVPLLSQNRQFQWFNNPTYIYPVIPAYAATLLDKNGYEVFWDDGIAEEITYRDWLERLTQQNPDLVAIETKTPVVKYHWRIIEELKKRCSNCRVVLMGDHVTALPEESMTNSAVDFIITGGDYDFSLLALCNYLSQEGKTEPASPPPSGIWYRDKEQILCSGAYAFNADLNDLPYIDRKLTNWQTYSEKNGNFKYRPGTYVMAGRDCWWGKCSFCSWTTLYPGDKFRSVSPQKHLDEIGLLIENFGIKEIFDDSGCFPKGKWLQEFCEGMIERGYHRKVVMGCNMRVGALNKHEWQLLKKANFRFVLIGLESLNQKTLNKLHKGIKVPQVEETLKMASKAGLEPHITTMVGYPWETAREAQETIDFAKHMFINGYISSLQATIVVPYPGTPMFEEARKNGWLLTEDWERYDMRESIWKSEIGTEQIQSFTQQLYKAALHPKFITRKILNIRNLDDIKFIYRAGLKVIGHLTDFKPHSKPQ